MKNISAQHYRNYNKGNSYIYQLANFQKQTDLCITHKCAYEWLLSLSLLPQSVAKATS